MTSNTRSAIFAAIAITVFILFVLVNHSKAIDISPVSYEESVFQFEDWYGIETSIAGKRIQREIVSFSRSTTLSVSVDKKQIVRIKIEPESDELEPVKLNSLWVDGKPKSIKLGYRTARSFVRGYKVKIIFTDAAKTPHSEEFSLMGFAKAYRWLTN